MHLTDRSSQPHKKHVCNMCGKAFDCRSALEIHERIHTGYKLKCAVCGQVFALKDTLTTHMLTHMHK